MSSNVETYLTDERRPRGLDDYCDGEPFTRNDVYRAIDAADETTDGHGAAAADIAQALSARLEEDDVEARLLQSPAFETAAYGDDRIGVRRDGDGPRYTHHRF